MQLLIEKDATCLSSADGLEKMSDCRDADDCPALVFLLFDNDCGWNMNEQELRRVAGADIG